MVNTLAGSYQSSAMVVMHNLRLPELDKNRNIEQHKALIFESDTCKYNVILGADFLNKTGIDVKYSTNTIEHLNIQQKADIKQALREFTKIFDGTLGVYPHQKFYIELEPNAKPKHARPYPIPVIHLEAFKKE